MNGTPMLRAGAALSTMPSAAGCTGRVSAVSVFALCLFAVAVLPAAVFSSAPAVAADAAHGKELFLACAACHSGKPDAIGPDLRGVYGRRSAALDDFRYSNPMKRANVVWDADNLRDYLIDPQAKVRGNRMPFGGVASPAEADDLVAFLETYK
jgi:cytochrome c